MSPLPVYIFRFIDPINIRFMIHNYINIMRRCFLQVCYYLSTPLLVTSIGDITSRELDSLTIQAYLLGHEEQRHETNHTDVDTRMIKIELSKNEVYCIFIWKDTHKSYFVEIWEKKFDKKTCLKKKYQQNEFLNLNSIYYILNK